MMGDAPTSTRNFRSATRQASVGAALADRGITRLIVGRKVAGAFGYLSLSDAGVPALPGFTRPTAFTF